MNIPQPHEIDKPTACIIAFKHQEGPRPIYYEVVVDPRQKTPSGKFIRMDASKGCEVHGWQPIDSFYVTEVLHEMSFEGFDARVGK